MAKMVDDLRKHSALGERTITFYAETTQAVLRIMEAEGLHTMPRGDLAGYHLHADGTREHGADEALHRSGHGQYAGRHGHVPFVIMTMNTERLIQ